MVDTAHHFACTLHWTGASKGPTADYETYSREVRVDFEGKPSLDMSSAPAFRGDVSRHNPEDLLVAALSSCHFLTYAAVCAKMGVHVVGYEDAATGIMERVERVTRFTSVVLHPRVTVARGTAPEKVELARTLHDKAHAGCFIASSVNFPVTHEATVVIEA
jgi:organic hydroperoxide reductase OsmC/OhrA